jgi:hypothetical protein
MDHFRHGGKLVGIAGALAMLINSLPFASAVSTSRPSYVGIGGLDQGGKVGVQAAQLPPSVPLQPADASATYNRSLTVAYAERYALSYNTSSYPDMSTISGSDCANFVSQALFAGGHPQRGNREIAPGFPYAATSTPYWYLFIYKGADDRKIWMYNAGWVRAKDLYNFERGSGRGSTLATYWAGSSTLPQVPSGFSPSGDLAFYDFGDGKGISHVAIAVGSGADNYNGCTGCANRYGTLVDSHDSDRYHVIWHLNSVNTRWQYTYVTLVHLNSTAS